MDSLVASALDTVRRRIAKAARAAGRDPSDITLTAVSKQQPEPAIQAVLNAGQRVFGETGFRRRRAAGPNGAPPCPVCTCG
ncbi:hypothetical protein [Brevundimonas denitrificans]|uniref:hypothetical protein n=1 Tax=Brevundimonas denitrificans TaxID=1443434 RepID=UPI00352CF4C8